MGKEAGGSKERDAEFRPNMVMLELEQVEKRMAKYKVPALDYLKVGKLDRYKWFRATQLINISTTTVRLIKVEQATRSISKYDVDMMSCLEIEIETN